MRILILNWRDIRNPQSGGAEILTHEMARRWVKWGHQVAQFSAIFPGCKKKEMIDGVKFVRAGSSDIRSLSLPIHWHAFCFYRQHQQQFDVVLDEIHGIPFFTPLFAPKRVALICEVAQEIWDKMFSFPWNTLGRWLEKIYFKIYKKTLFLTISPSTKKDLINSGIPKKNIVILPMGVTLNLPKKLSAKEKEPTLIFVGRLCQMKGIVDAIRAFKLIMAKFPKAKLWIVGSGDNEYTAQLRKLVKQEKIVDKVKFWGFVSEKRKFNLLARAHLLLHPSQREGWGLVVHEANSVATPAVGYNSPGLKDIIKDGVNGVLCQRNPQAMSQKVINLLKKKRFYCQLQNGGRQEVKKADWDKTAKAALAVFDKL